MNEQRFVVNTSLKPFDVSFHDIKYINECHVHDEGAAVKWLALSPPQQVIWVQTLGPFCVALAHVLPTPPHLPPTVHARLIGDSSTHRCECEWVRLFVFIMSILGSCSGIGTSYPVQ